MQDDALLQELAGKNPEPLKNHIKRVCGANNPLWWQR